METALMSGTPVPIYVKKRSNSTASAKFFRASSKKVKHTKKSSKENRRSDTSSEQVAGNIENNENSRPSSLENAHALPPLELKLSLKSEAAKYPSAKAATVNILLQPPDSPPPKRQLPEIPVLTENWPLANQNNNSANTKSHLNNHTAFKGPSANANGHCLSDSDASAHKAQPNHVRSLNAKPRGRTKLVKNPPPNSSKPASKSPAPERPSPAARSPLRTLNISAPIPIDAVPEITKPPKSYYPPTGATFPDAGVAPAPPSASSTTTPVPAPLSERQPPSRPERQPASKPNRPASSHLEPPPRSPSRLRGSGQSADESGFLSGLEAGNMNHYIQSNGSGLLNPGAAYQHIHDMAAKRVSTLDYLRKTHEGRVYWFNTLLFSRNDISRLPSFDPKKLAKRAANLLILGLSLPSILDLNTLGPLDFLRALNALLLEFETYQQIHPSDGSNASSLSRARLPQMFKRSTNIKARRTSSAADIGLPFGGSDPSDIKSMSSGMSSAAGASTISLAMSEDLLPGEEYTYLITPSLPFDPDFFEVFASLCDVLIDCYMRITGLVSSPEKCGPGVAEVFAKVDSRLRKVIVTGIVKEFEDATRFGVKGEVAGIGKVVLGGLI